MRDRDASRPTPVRGGHHRPARRSAPAHPGRFAISERLEPRRLLAVAMVADFNAVPYTGGAPTGLDATEPVRIGDVLYFTSLDRATGAELWKTDGTPAGTSIVRDILPGGLSSGPKHLTAVGDRLFFIADDGISGRELWKTDGTADGTVLVADLSPGPASSFAYRFWDGGGVLFFIGPGAGGPDTAALWRSDGTAPGTRPVKQMTHSFEGTLTTGVRPHRAAAAVGNTSYFMGSNGATGQELWKTDGTEAGTVLVKDINPGAAHSRPAEFTVVGNRLFFSASDGRTGVDPWVSDGTDAGTRLLRDSVGNRSGVFADPSAVGGTLYFLGGSRDRFGTVVSGFLWRTDGTDAGTQVVTGPPQYKIGEIEASGGFIYFVTGETHLWRSDTTFASPTLVKAFESGPQYTSITSLRDLGNGRLFFQGRDGDPWLTDGTPQGTVRIADLGTDQGGWGAKLPHVVGGRLVFRASDPAGAALWAADPTDPGAGAAPLHRNTATDASNASAHPVDPARDVVLISANDGAGYRLLRSDGTDAGTHVLSDFGAAPRSASAGLVGRVAGRAILSVEFTGGVKELWITDGTTAGTTPLAPDLTLNHQVPHRGRLYFFNQGGTFSSGERGLWVTDGTPGGTKLVKSFPATSWVNEAASDGTLIHLSVHSNSTGQSSLWKSDGTTAGTQQVQTLERLATGLAAAGGTMFFWQHNSSTWQYDLWKTDSTVAGTALVKSGLRDAGVLAGEYKGRLFFRAWNAEHGYELWSSDGTAANTARVTDVDPDAAWSDIGDTVVFNGLLYFTTSRGIYRTDGTAAGTVRIPSITGEPVVMWGDTTTLRTGGLTPVGDTLYFAGVSHHQRGDGEELWKLNADGTGLVRVADISPGRESSSIHWLTAAGDTLYFMADDGQHSSELWRVTPGDAPAVTGAHLFYNNSAHDGGSPAAGADDLRAVATDVRPLRPGGTASGANVSNYTRGINGVLVDFLGAPPRELAADDFEFATRGAGGAWSPAPVPSAVSLLPAWRGADAARYAITFPDGAVRNTWLRVTVKANADTGLAAPAVFYFGNLVGDTGGPRAPSVDAADLALTRAHLGKTTPAALRTYDVNRDGVVNVADLLTVRSNLRRTLAPLVAPAALPREAPSAAGMPAAPRPLATRPPRRDLLEDPSREPLV